MEERRPTGREADPPTRIAAAIEAGRAAPGLYLVATPIGAARDITLRALDLLNTADLLAAEDTRTLRHLMAIHGIPLRGRRIVAYHEHNEAGGAGPVLAALAAGQVVAYASEAGTPLVSDPGFRLAREAIAAGASVHAAPGASAVLAALTVAGLPSDRFLFAGFAPTADGARRRWLDGLLGVDATLVLFESPRRVRDLLGNLCEKTGERQVVICRELTKRFEEVIRGTAQALLADPRTEDPKGEIVVLIDRAAVAGPSLEEAGALMAAARGRGLSARDAAREVAEATGLGRRELYQLGLKEGRE